MKKRGELTNALPDDPSSGRHSAPRPAGLDRAAELKLIDAALLGDMQAFSKIFEHYRPALYGLCYRRLNDDSLAEDVVQEAFLKAFKNLPDSDHRKPIWPWLATIANRMCIDLQRRRSFTFYSGNIGAFVDAKADQAESAIDEVIASEERAEFWKSLDILPERQRRVLLLYAVEGLSGAEIASAEGISAAAVRRLLFRARRKMWAARQNGPLSAIVLPFAGLGWKVQRLADRIRMLFGVNGEGLSGASMQVVSLGMLAVVAVAVGHPVATFEGTNAVFDETIPLVAFSQPTQSNNFRTALPNTVVPSEAAADSRPSVAETARSLTDDVMNPNHDATPENTLFSSITTSPNYESDHTILASGWHRPNDGAGSYVLFVSHDGGGNWKPLPSRLFSGRAIALPASFPQDRRIFALGDFGLQQSDDGGQIFNTVSPTGGWQIMGWNLAISPLFGRGDSRILSGGKTLFEYDADRGVTRPGSIAIPPSRGTYSSISFSPGYQSDRTLFVSDPFAKSTLLNPGYVQTSLYRCKETVCDETQLPISGALTLRLSPRFDQDGLAYTYTSSKLLVSNDGVRTFREIQLPIPDLGSIADVAVLWNKYSEPAIFAAVSGGVYRSLDGGASWNGTQLVDITGFDYGVHRLIVTPTGRLLASGTQYQIVCSKDEGLTWDRRCPPES